MTDFEWTAEEDLMGEQMLPGGVNRDLLGVYGGRGGQTFQARAPAGAGVRQAGE